MTATGPAHSSASARRRGRRPGLAPAGVVAIVLTLAAPPPAGAVTVGARADMVAIPGGSYPVGAVDGRRDARPVHAVTLAPFHIDRFEVTNADFALFLNAAGLDVRILRDRTAGMVRAGDLAGPDAARLLEGAEGTQRRPWFALDDAQSRIGIADGRFAAAPGWEDHPVGEVTWEGAAAFCSWRGARLPTEAEWEAAARGREGRAYPWGNEAPAERHAVFGRGSGRTEPVGSRPAGATPEGVHDLAGNMQEWTSTLYRPYPYRADDGREAPGDPGERVTRGGDHVFDSAADELTGFHRTGYSRAPDRGHRHIGFRCARDTG